MTVPDANAILYDDGETALRNAFDRGRVEIDVQGAQGNPGHSEPEKGLLRFKLYRDFPEEARKVWLVRGLLGLGEFSVFFGEPSAGKSVLLGDLHLHVAGELDWYGRTTKGGLAVYLALERSKVVERRAMAFRTRHPELTDIPFAIVPGPLNFTDKATAKVVLDAIRRIEDAAGKGLVLLGIDTVSAALCGGDENSPKDMGAFVNTIRSIQDGTKAHIVAAHHTPHETARLRGHGALLGAVDTTIEVNGKSEGGTRTATVRKANDGEEGLQVNFTLESVIVGQSDEGPTTAPLVVPVGIIAKVDPAKTKRGARLTNGAKIALEALREQVIDTGAEAPPSNTIPNNAKVVLINQWKQRAYNRGLAVDAGDRGRRVAFQRASESLVAVGMIGVSEPFVWLAG